MAGIFVGAFDNASKIVPVVKEAAPLIASGRLHVPIAADYDLEDIQKGVAHVRRGGKVPPGSVRHLSMPHQTPVVSAS